MDEKLYFIKDKKTNKLLQIKFREKTYVVEDPKSVDVWKKINADYPDFNASLYETIKNNGGLITQFSKSAKTVYVDPTETLKRANKAGKKAKLTKVKAGVAASLIILGTCVGSILGAKGCQKDDTTETQEIVLDDELEDDILELLKQLDEGIQRDSWTTINEFQDYFNNTAAEEYAIEEDGEARLHLTAEQCIALFVRFNADRITPEDMAYIFGSNSSWFTFANMDEEFTEAARILNYYYLSATTKSGLDMLFVDESDKKLFSDFEQLVLNYNKDRTDENKEAINDSLYNIFLNPSLDDPKTTNAGAASAIGTAMVPILHATRVIDEDELNELTEINETVTCNKLGRLVEEATSIEVEQTGKRVEEILEELPEIMDKNNIKNYNMDIDFETRYNEFLVDTYGEDYVYGNEPINSYQEQVISTVTSGVTGEEITREEAVAEFGEEAVEEAEEEAKEEFEDTYGEKNRKQEAYGQGLSAIANSSLYDNAYDYVVANGSKPSASQFSSIISSVKNSYSGSYQTSFENGVVDGASNIISNAYNDAMVEYNARKNISDEGTVTITEEYVKEEDLPVATATPVPATKAPVATATPVPATKAPVATATPVPATKAPVATEAPTVTTTVEEVGNYEITTTVEEEYIPESELNGMSSEYISQEELDSMNIDGIYDDYSSEELEKGPVRVR